MKEDAEVKDATDVVSDTHTSEDRHECLNRKCGGQVTIFKSTKL